MLLLSLLLIPLIGAFAIFINKDSELSVVNIKFIALITSTLDFFISLVIFILFDFSTNQFQFVEEYHKTSYFDFYLGVDGLSIYFILLTTLIIPISLVSNWKSIIKDVKSFVITILLLQSLLLAVFLVLDILLYYIFFESILPPLFILVGIFGSDNRVKASFYLFLYTLLGSLFLLLSILAMSSIMSITDLDTLFKGNFIYLIQLFLFYGIFIAFAVKTPTIFLNTWLLKAHVESPLGGSIILAAIVLKLSLYGILRLILPILPKAYMEYTYIIFLIGVITIVYASLSTLRTIDIKELIAYSSVSHAAVYLLGVFSNSIQGIEGAINLGLAHGLVSPGLFICAGGILYDRTHTRVISFYRGVTQVMPLFSILFFLLCLANCGAPLTLNFVGEFLSLYGVFERSSLFGVFASSSIIFSAAYTIYMYQRIAFGGVYSNMFTFSMPDVTKREFTVLVILVVPTVLLGIYPAAILDAIHYSVSTLIYSFDFTIISCDAPRGWENYFKDSITFISNLSFGDVHKGSLCIIGLVIMINTYIHKKKDGKSILFYINNKHLLLQYIKNNILFFLCVGIVLVMVNYLLKVLGLDIPVSTETPILFCYTRFCRLTNCVLIILLMNSVRNKKFKLEYASLSLFNVVCFFCIGAIHYYFILPLGISMLSSLIKLENIDKNPDLDLKDQIILCGLPGNPENPFSTDCVMDTSSIINRHSLPGNPENTFSTDCVMDTSSIINCHSLPDIIFDENGIITYNSNRLSPEELRHIMSIGFMNNPVPYAQPISNMQPLRDYLYASAENVIENRIKKEVVSRVVSLADIGFAYSNSGAKKGTFVCSEPQYGEMPEGYGYGGVLERSEHAKNLSKATKDHPFLISNTGQTKVKNILLHLDKKYGTNGPTIRTAKDIRK